MFLSFPLLHSEFFHSKLLLFYISNSQVIKVEHEAHGVDVPEDVEKIERYMREKNLS